MKINLFLLFSLIFAFSALLAQQEHRSKVTLSFTATHLSSALAEKMVQLSREGQVDVIDLTLNIEDALYALEDRMADGVFWASHLSLGQIQQIKDIRQLVNHDQSIPFQAQTLDTVSRQEIQTQQVEKMEHLLVASSTAHWVSKASATGREISITLLSKMIEGKVNQWPDGRPFILYLRTIADPLEMAWRSRHPILDQAFAQARKQQKWILIEDEELLRSKLKQQQYICSLSDQAHLNLFASPVWKIQIKDTQGHSLENPMIYYYFSYYPSTLQDPHKKIDLENWLMFIKSKDDSMIQDFGWDMPK